jgi:nitronate monooxygenase
MSQSYDRSTRQALRHIEFPTFYPFLFAAVRNSFASSWKLAALTETFAGITGVGVQIGTAYLGCPEATISALHREALGREGRETVITNVLSGRPARSIVNRIIREQGPINNSSLPAYPLATPALAPLRAKAEAKGSSDFSPLWSGQGAPPPTGIGAGELTRKFADEALTLLG